MRKMTMFLLIVGMATLLWGAPDETWIECDALKECPEEMTCVKFSDMPMAVCWPAEKDPCDYCGGGDCAIMESYPPQVVCGDDWPEPEKCKEDKDCPEKMFCFNGYCAGGDDPTDATTCKNEAGYCVIGETSGYCQCITGGGTAWSEAGPGEPTDPVEDGDGEVPPVPFFLPSQGECTAILVEQCGEKAPDLNEECSEGMLDACIDAVDWVMDTCYEPLSAEDIAAVKRGEWVGELSMMVYSCCTETTLDELDGELDELKECIAEEGCDECLDAAGEEPYPMVPCVEDSDCGEGIECIEGFCDFGDERPVDTGDNPTNPGDDQTGGEDYTNTDGKGAEASTTKEASSAACSLVLI